MEILTILLVFALPLLSVILDKKKKSGTPKVKSRRIVLPGGQVSPEAADTQARRKATVTGHYMSTTVNPKKPAAPVKGDEARSAAVAAAEYEAVTAGDKPAARAGRQAATAGRRSREAGKPGNPAETEENGKKFSERQKLIIYSELLKPKFDEL